MSLETGIYSYLSGLSDVNSLLGGAASPRIYPGVGPQDDAYPRVTFSPISDTPDHDMAGATGLTNALVQFDVWALSSSSRRTIAAAMKNALDGLIGGTMGGLSIDSVFLKSRRATEEAPENASELALFRMSMDFEIWYTEAIPTLS